MAFSTENMDQVKTSLFILSYLSAVVVANSYLPTLLQANRFIRFENVSAPDEVVLHWDITNQCSSILFL